MKNNILPAAFGRLCVETDVCDKSKNNAMPAAFGRLCVETGKTLMAVSDLANQPPSGGCVLKLL